MSSGSAHDEEAMLCWNTIVRNGDHFQLEHWVQAADAVIGVRKYSHSDIQAVMANVQLGWGKPNACGLTWPEFHKYMCDCLKESSTADQVVSLVAVPGTHAILAPAKATVCSKAMAEINDKFRPVDVIMAYKRKLLIQRVQKERRAISTFQSRRQPGPTTEEAPPPRRHHDLPRSDGDNLPGPTPPHMTPAGSSHTTSHPVRFGDAAYTTKPATAAPAAPASHRRKSSHLDWTFLGSDDANNPTLQDDLSAIQDWKYASLDEDTLSMATARNVTYSGVGSFASPSGSPLASCTLSGGAGQFIPARAYCSTSGLPTRHTSTLPDAAGVEPLTARTQPPARVSLDIRAGALPAPPTALADLKARRKSLVAAVCTHQHLQQQQLAHSHHAAALPIAAAGCVAGGAISNQRGKVQLPGSSQPGSRSLSGPLATANTNTPEALSRAAQIARMRSDLAAAGITTTR